MPPKIPPNKSPTPALRPGWRDGEDPIPGIKPKPKPPPPADGDSKEVTLGWADEPAMPGDHEEIVRRSARPPGDFMTVEAQADWKGILSTTRDGAPIPEGHDDAGISLDYDPVEICAANFAEIIGEELYEDDAVEIDVDEDLPSVTIGAFTFTISTTIRGGAARLARSLHALGEALRHSAAEAALCPDCVSEPCHACIAEEE